MQENNTGQSGGTGGAPKQSGLSWSQPARSDSAPASSSVAGVAAAGAAKPTAQVSTKPMAQTAAKPAQTSVERKPATGTAAGNTPRLVGTFAAGVIVGGLLTWGGMSLTLGDTAQEVAMGDTTNTQGSATAPLNTSVAANTQVSNVIPSGTAANFAVADQGAGMQVEAILSKVTTPTWLIVYDDDNGAPGWILGAGMVFPETGSQVVIDLLRPTIAGKSYFVGQSADMHSDHLFSVDQEISLVDSGGNLVADTFIVR